ncbi:conserved hypothetical protein [Chthoniobacter flavus Ellin428]|uniref:Uncharacterized protein n=1 Tax=Chthoniobacter flavus Ellin428 TaxID=497964 RepID=B4D7G9_9BACT|nr:hypothetical protein [Chthoniobacter flavus]EDY17586.1 conserved hypothetical protein [Chthoniobacter flavus Ellin428]
MLLPSIVLAGRALTDDAASGPTVILGNKPADAAASQARAAVSPAIDLNEIIRQKIASMPVGGSYRANSIAIAALRQSIQLTDSQLAINPHVAQPSFCSGATYLVFLSVLKQLARDGQIQLDAVTLRSLLIQEPQPDGNGVWGRWNANGPGTARLFYETGIGYNFTSLEEARPGDFLKIFWHDEIGARETGHSVVYLGTVNTPQGQAVRYWSSNLANGYGEAIVPRQRIRRMLFSRLVHPERIQQVNALSPRDAYLAAMLQRDSTPEEMYRMVGVTNPPPPLPPPPKPPAQIRRLLGGTSGR